MKRAILLVLSLLLAALLITSCGQEPKVNPEPEPTPTSYGLFKVGDKNYYTLQRAVNAAKEVANDAKATVPTIVLTGDVVDAGAVIDTDVKLDFGSYTYTLKNSMTGIEIKAGNTVEVKGGKFAASTNGATSLFKANGNLALGSTEVNLSGTDLNAIATENGATTINNNVKITVSDNKDIVSATGGSVTVQEGANVSLTGSFTLSGEATVNLADSDLNLTRAIEKEAGANIQIDGYTPSVISEADITEEYVIYESYTPYSPSDPTPENYNPSIKVNFAPNDLSVTVNTDDPYVVYQWYSSANADMSEKTAIPNATSATMSISDYMEKGNYFVYCGVSTWTGENEVFSEVAKVCYTGLPTVYVSVPGEGDWPITDEKKETWVGATITIKSADNIKFILPDTATSIRGRGNSTWNLAKKPFALKLDKKVSVLGFPKHKRWVLLANYIDDSYLKNSMAFWLSEALDMDYTVRGDFVDLVVNNEYQGLYWLGEQIKVDENRVAIDDELDYLIELDTYYDENWRFHSYYKQLPYMIKNDDKMTFEKLSSLNLRIKDIESKLSAGTPDVSNMDLTSWAKAFIVLKIMGNGEVIHPKSFYAVYDSREDKLKAGPVWDFDWSALGAEYVYYSASIEASLYYPELLQSEAFQDELTRVWNTYKSVIENNYLTVLESYKNSQLKYAAQLDNEKWGIMKNRPQGSEYRHGSGQYQLLNSFEEYVELLENKIQLGIAAVQNVVDGF